MEVGLARLSLKVPGACQVRCLYGSCATDQLTEQTPSLQSHRTDPLFALVGWVPGDGRRQWGFVGVQWWPGLATCRQ